MVNKIPTSFKDTFGLVIDPLYPQLVQVANIFKRGKEYTTAEVMFSISNKYRKTKFTDDEWFYKLNRTIDALVHYDLLVYKVGYYSRSKKDTWHS